MALHLDAYPGWTADQLRRRCVELVSIAMKKDMLICSLVEFGSADKIPDKRCADEIRRIVSVYFGDEN